MIIKRLGSILFWAFLLGSSILLFPVALLLWTTTIVDRKGVVLHRFTCFWASLYSWTNPAWRVRIEGRNKIRPNVPYVMVANHQSLLDVLILFRLFVHFKWVSKIEMFRVPFVGWNMALNRYIKLKRGDQTSTEQMMRDCERTLRSGSSIMMFPEGTRSPDGRLRPFKHGAFTLAQRVGVPLLLVSVQGTARVLPKSGLVLQGKHTITIRVLGEIPYEEFADTATEELTQQVHDRFAAALDEESPDMAGKTVAAPQRSPRIRVAERLQQARLGLAEAATGCYRPLRTRVPGV